MKLSLNPSEARTLLRMLYLAEHVLVADGEAVPEAFLLKCGALMDKLLPAARDGGCPDLIEEDIDGSLHLSPDIEDEPGVLEAITEFEGNLFWEELVSRLAERDFELNTGKPALPDPEETAPEELEEALDERLEELGRLESSYWSEFEKHGVRNVHVVRGTGSFS